MTGAVGSILEELAMGSSASVLEVLASGGCGETAVLVCVRDKEETIWVTLNVSTSIHWFLRSSLPQKIG